MTTILAFFLLSATTLLVLGSLRMVASDTVTALSNAVQQARRGGALGAKLAFASLWALIFMLSFA